MDVSNPSTFESPTDSSSPEGCNCASFIPVLCRLARHTSRDESTNGHSGKIQSFNCESLSIRDRGMRWGGGSRGGGGGGGGGTRHQSSNPSSGPLKLNNPTPADLSLSLTWSQVFLKNRASSAQELH